MPRRATTLTAVLAAASLAAGLVPAAASAERPAPTDKALKSDQGTPPVTTGRPDGAGDGRKN